MTAPHAGASPRFKARITGALWLLVIGASALAFTPLATLIVPDDPAATADNILANVSMFRLSIVAEIFASLCYVGVTVILYELLKPVSRSLSLFAAFSGLAGIAIAGPNFLVRVATLVLLTSDELPTTFTQSQLHAMAFTSLELHGFGLNICLAFFGLQCITVGYLIVRSTFLPGILGVLLGIAGVGYVIGFLSKILSPSLSQAVGPLVMPPALVGEGALSLWLLFRGLNAGQWARQNIPDPIE